jgi:hypothetical protein
MLFGDYPEVRAAPLLLLFDELWEYTYGAQEICVT